MKRVCAVLAFALAAACASRSAAPLSQLDEGFPPFEHPRDYQTELGTVRERMREIVGMPEGAIECHWTRVAPKEDAQLSVGEEVLGALTMRDCCCRMDSAPAVVDGKRIVVTSPAGFVVWESGWARGREIELGRWSFRRSALAHHQPKLSFDGDVWTIEVGDDVVFASRDAGVTWKPVHAEASET